MKRRSFLRSVGLGTGSMMTAGKISARGLLPVQVNRFDVQSYKDLVTRDGYTMIRLNYSGTGKNSLAHHEGAFKVEQGKLHEVKAYFFQPGEDNFDPEVPGMHTTSFQGFEDVILLIIADADQNTVIKFPVGSDEKEITIDEIIRQLEIEFSSEESKVVISYLLDREIGEIDAGKQGISENGESFTFTVMADPQGGNPFAHELVETRMRIHNAFIDESVRLINELDPPPAFNIVIGDIVDGQGHHSDFRAMNDMLHKVKVPTLYGLGNHETRYKSVFTPGYNMDAFNNYFAAQKEFNGMEELLYSFNLGKWHFIVWPDPLRNNFWQTHPHYFYWLEKDLEKYRNRPVFFLQHIPVHPIGILPLINYAESVDVKRTLLNILAKHGNVRYVLSGHVHIPMKASVKTSVTFKGIKFINLPAAGYRPRAFGEEDFNGGPTQGIAIIEVRGEEAEIHFKTVTNEQYKYPVPPPFHENDYPLWLNHKWEIAEHNQLRNGNFSDGLKFWHKRYVYIEDEDPSNLCESRTTPEGKRYLYIFNKSRGYNTPGQDRLPQSINRICQVIRQEPGTIPFITMEYLIDPDYFIPENLAGSYIWIEGFEQGLKRLNVVYSNSYVHWHLGGNQSQLRTALPVHMDITDSPSTWRKLFLNPFGDFAKYSEEKDKLLNDIDTIAINLGVWTLNEGYKRYAAAGFANVEVQIRTPNQVFASESMIANRKIPRKEQKYLWWHGVKHAAGDHQSIVEDLNKYVNDIKR